MDIDKRLETNRNKSTAESVTKYILITSSVIIVLLVAGMAFTLFQLHQLQGDIQYMQSSLPQSSCDATVGENTIQCQ